MSPVALSLCRRSLTDLQPLTDDFVASRNLTDQQLFTYASVSRAVSGWGFTLPGGLTVSWF